MGSRPTIPAMKRLSVTILLALALCVPVRQEAAAAAAPADGFVLLPGGESAIGSPDLERQR